ncbi:rCG38492 [Rattus norvegicus]|uniref:RCG38492 n=1 Tax=Rattus norvegicus TaxID=10116 RepID=A6KM78_RAT|nr:rCG38492 [Rattus norvegicus]
MLSQCSNLKGSFAQHRPTKVPYQASAYHKVRTGLHLMWRKQDSIGCLALPSNMNFYFSHQTVCTEKPHNEVPMLNTPSE